MHGLQIRWADTNKEMEYWFETLEEWNSTVGIAQILGAAVRYWSAILNGWTRWF